MWLVVLFAASHVCFCAQGVTSVDHAFKPVCIGADFSSDEVRPGGQIAVSLCFRNEGTAPAKADYQIFVHVEYPDKDCADIRVQSDHAPTAPTSAWLPGEVIHDGAQVLSFPESCPAGTYYLHVGLYSLKDAGRPRVYDRYVAEIKVSLSAPKVQVSPPPMRRSDVASRRAALIARLHDPVTVENSRLSFKISRRTGVWALTDRSTGEVWYSDPECERFAEVTFRNGDDLVTREVNSFSSIHSRDGRIDLTYRPDIEGAPPVGFRIELLPGTKGIRFSYSEIGQPKSGTPNGDWHIANVRLLDRGLWAVDTEHGYMAVPYRLGIMLPSWEGLPSTTLYHSYSNYNSYSMAMFGVVKNGSALLVHWSDPYTTFEVQHSWVDARCVPGHGLVSASVILSDTAKSFVIQPIGKGGYAEIAHAYREVARERGLLRTWSDKIKANPRAEFMLGAADFKPFVFSRTHPHTRWNPSDAETTRLTQTFPEVAEIAEHLKKDLGIDRAMLVLAGWIHGGYDNQHPDILPASEECGGNEGLADCARRVKSLGFLFGLHDNYQDMYRDAPSWDESYIMRLPDGALHAGGVWAGGQAYLTCSEKAIELAKREQNLPSVKKLFDPTIYFIDTVFAAPPFECSSPQHPLSLTDDLHWKRALSEYARGTFGLFGSEEGQEWAVPCADYFEGLLSHKTEMISAQIVIPLFEMVYGDCINLYTHQSDRATPDRPEYVLDHILYAEMPVYHFGARLYYKLGNSRAPIEPSVHSLKQTGPRTFEITYAWHVKSSVDKDYSCIVHFVKPDSAEVEQPVFQNDHRLARPTSTWKPGETVIDGPYTLEVPEHVDGRYGILIGLWDGTRRAELIGVERTNLRYQIGALTVSAGKIGLRPASGAVDALCFARYDGVGDINQTDRFIRNTYEILSPLNRITAHTPMTSHEFLTADRRVERTRFGDVVTTVNAGGIPYRMEHAVLPRYGFIVESPTYVAFHATEYAGKRFAQPTMLTARSLDGKPLATSRNVRIYKAFGDSQVTISGREFTAE